MSDFAFEPRRVEKPWGWELIWALTDHYCGKLLFVQAGEALSLQYHEGKDESWYVQQGRAELEIGPLTAVNERSSRSARRTASTSRRGPSTACVRSRTR